MMKTVTTVLGAVLTLIAVIGFVNHGAMGMNLSNVHNGLLLIGGILGLYFGVLGTEFQARYFCRGLGVVLILAGLIGMFQGRGTTTLNQLANRNTSHLWYLIPTQLELGTVDSITNLVLGVIAAIAGFFPREKEIEIDMATAKARQKVTTAR
jgi:hypothetical protein